MVFTRRRPLKANLRSSWRAWRAWSGLLLAVAFALASVHSGAHYFYCQAYGLTTFDPCARASHEGARGPLDGLRSTPFDCCERITMPSMPDAARAQEPAVAPAGLVAVLPPPDGTCPALHVIAPARARFEGRWRGPPRWGEDPRTQSMVSLT